MGATDIAQIWIVTQLHPHQDPPFRDAATAATGVGTCSSSENEKRMYHGAMLVAMPESGAGDRLEREQE